MERLDYSGLLFPSLHPSPSGSLPRREKQPTPKMKERRPYLYLDHHLLMLVPLEESRRVYCTIETTWINYHTIGVTPTLEGRLYEAPSIGALPWWCKFRPWGAGGTPLPLGIRRGLGTQPPRWGLGQSPNTTAIEMLWDLGQRPIPLLFS